MFGAGTACVVCPISRILYVNEELNIPTMKNNAELSRRFLNVLTDIQVKNAVLFNTTIRCSFDIYPIHGNNVTYINDPF